MKSQTGLSLVELMIAMVISLMLLIGIITIFLQTKNSFNQNEKLARMQDDARFVLEELSNDISMAGFWAEINNQSNITPDTNLAVINDCGPAGTAWVYDLTQELGSVDNATGVQANAAHSCINSGSHLAGTDVISVKRTSSNTVAVLDVNEVYLKSNVSVGLLLRHPEAVPPAAIVPAPSSHMEYSPAVYYVRNHGSDGDTGDGIPTLCRKFLDTNSVPTMSEECLAQGVEDLQFEFGIDTNADGVVDQYVPDPTAVQLQRLVSVRIFLLVRSILPNVGYVNDKSYQLSNKPAVTMNDGFYRRLFTTTVMVRNARNRLTFGT